MKDSQISEYIHFDQEGNQTVKKNAGDYCQATWKQNPLSQIKKQ